MAADPVGSEQLAGPERQQEIYERLGLSAAVLVERALAIVAGVPPLASRGGVPDDEHRGCVDRRLAEPAQHLAIQRIVHLAHRVLQGKPLQFVHFVVGRELTCDRAGSPVPNLLRGVLDGIADRRQMTPEMGAEARLLRYFSNGSDRFDLTAFEFPLGRDQSSYRGRWTTAISG